MMTRNQTTTLDQPFVRGELDAMRAAADAQEDVLRERVAGARTAAGAPLSEADMAGLLRDAWISVPREVGEFLALLVRGCRARTVVEFGTSFGVSTIYLAAAVRDNGGGVVVTTEIEESKAEVAMAHVRRCGLCDVVDMRVGDARETLTDLPGPVDLVLLDGWSPLYLPVLRVLEPALRDGALAVADDTGQFADDLVDYVGHVRDAARGWHSVALPLGDGLEVSTFTAR